VSASPSGRPFHALAHGVARAVDPAHQLGHVAEQAVRLHHRIELRLAVGGEVFAIDAFDPSCLHFLS
jgi:hypothetical protein